MHIWDGKVSVINEHLYQALGALDHNTAPILLSLHFRQMVY